MEPACNRKENLVPCGSITGRFHCIIPPSTKGYWHTTGSGFGWTAYLSTPFLDQPNNYNLLKDPLSEIKDVKECKHSNKLKWMVQSEMCIAKFNNKHQLEPLAHKNKTWNILHKQDIKKITRGTSLFLHNTLEFYKIKTAVHLPQNWGEETLKCNTCYISLWVSHTHHSDIISSCTRHTVKAASDNVLLGCLVGTRLLAFHN